MSAVGGQEGQGVVVPHQNDLGVRVQGSQFLEDLFHVGHGLIPGLVTDLLHAGIQQLQGSLQLFRGQVQVFQALFQGLEGLEIQLPHGARQQGDQQFGGLAVGGSAHGPHELQHSVVGADEQGDQVGVCQFLPQGRQVVVGDTGGGGAGPDQVQDVAAHGSRHPVVHGMVPVQAQGVGHPGHIAVFGVIMVVFLHIIALGGAGKVGVLQAHAGGDAVTQGNIGIGIFLCCKGRQYRQHQQCQGQQQADKTFFHNEPPYMANSEKITFPEPSGSDVPDICGRRRWGGRRWPPGCRRQRQKPRRTAGPASAPSGSGCGSA